MVPAQEARPLDNDPDSPTEEEEEEEEAGVVLDLQRNDNTSTDALMTTLEDLLQEEDTDVVAQGRVLTPDTFKARSSAV